MSQTWHVFPLDFGRYLLVNMSSGFVVNIVSNSTQPSAPAEQFHLQLPQDRPTQEWVLRPVAGGINQQYEVVNAESQLSLNVVGFSLHRSARVEQFTRANGSDFRSQTWAFLIENEYRPVLDLQPGNDSIGDVNRMTSFADPKPASTTPVLAGSMAYPFPLVRDPAYSRERQSRENPYYILRKFGFWTKVFFYDHGGASEYTHEETTRVGLTTTNATTVENTTGISVSAEASFGFKGFGASLSTTMSQQLRVETTKTVSHESSREVTIRRTYPAGIRVAEAIWYRDDRFVLERLDGSRVLEWVTRNPNRTVADTFRG
ncbi:RICIN domain-containing protein [Streptomyces sp. MBT57]|nr:RICIN domain-containing protein [Streptomyces sp. MBT57]